MIRGIGMQVRGQVGGCIRSELIGVDPYTQPEPPRRLENPPRLRDREHVRLAKHIAILRETFRCDARQHFVHDQVHIVVDAPAVLVRNLVRAEKRRNVIQLPYDAQDLQFIVQR